MGVTSSTNPKLAPVLFATCAVLAALFAATLGVARASAAAPMQLGVYLPGGGGSASTLDSYSSMVGRNPDILLIFRNMEGPLLYSSEVSNLKARNETPMVTLEPYANGGVASFADIAAGKYDSYFRKEADAVRGAGVTVMLRFAHEMNLLSSDWGPGKAGNNGSAYVEAWQHIVTVFRQEGATNVKWVWAPNVDYGGRPFTQFFPGDEYVDYVGLDGYNWGTSDGESFESFSKVFASSYATITQLSSKPLIVTETASSESGGNKAAWIEETFFRTIPQTMPRVQAVIWFNDDKELDWRVNSSQASLDAYRKVVASSLYGGTQPPPAPAAEPAPVVRELAVVPKPRPAPASLPVAEAPARQQSSGNGGAAGRRHRRHHGVVLRGRITYALSQGAQVRIALRRPNATPLVFTAEQNAGHKRVSLAQLVGKRRMRRGAYRVSIVARTSTGTRSTPRSHRFHIAVPGRSRHH
jgi:Glycosyl hydrolase family 26